MLRTATEPMTVREIAFEVMERCGVPTNDWRTVKIVGYAIRDAMKRGEGDLVVSTNDNPRRWAVIGRIEVEPPTTLERLLEGPPTETT